MSLPRLAVLCDYPEENWPSMDLCAEMLCRHLSADHSDSVRAARICPTYRKRASRVPWLGKHKAAQNLDRLLNRFWDYPRYLRRYVGEYDCFHLCDHSYAHLVHELPAQHTGVQCHDLDTFRCLLEPRLNPRPRWFRLMARRILAGLQKAALVFYVSVSTRQQIEKYGLVDPSKLVYAPDGIAPEFASTPVEEESNVVPAELDGRPYLLHVGSCIPRKRIDVLLDVFARVRAWHPDLMLVQVGGSWTASQQKQIEHLDIGTSLIQLRGLDRKALAEFYRRAALVLQPSEAEGFGLPVVEALACGSIVVASDIPVLREVGGEAAVYCPLGDVEAWVHTVCRLIESPAMAPDRSLRLAHAQQFTWAAQASTIVNAYQRLLQE